MARKTGIERAVAIYGGSPTKLAAACGDSISRQNIEHWLKAKRVPLDHCAAVSAATGIDLEDLNDKWAAVREVVKA